MDPISLIIAALGAGAIAASKDIAGTAVKDAYQGFKTLIKKKFEGDPVAQVLVDAKPEQIKQTEDLLKDSITKAGVDKDEEIIKAAQELLKQEKPEEFKAGKFNITGGVKGIVAEHISGGKIDQIIN
ncbi:hypothetical protein [Nostoc sp. 'Peltigera membranacea cyanobiont' N6]|uniref:hypothetical protein n=1 Tax=Nostoc sp. 'Peltigera membranacea cyanobiont' N6 TaxID=1261031 RepID=UPI000CF30033|nr:hypothetical protein [Nostoc sp. 'Peltigera membranacea cyanobiont' N6]AVH68388.1 hypothetical protein NPM_20103 [Nostoc sp. 'Peltigera membranacea cyanobiont' N6]